jgi:hypothetical protein
MIIVKCTKNLLVQTHGGWYREVVFHAGGARLSLTGKTEKLGEKTCPSATLSITKLTWTDPGAKPGLLGERPFY